VPGGHAMAAAFLVLVTAVAAGPNEGAPVKAGPTKEAKAEALSDEDLAIVEDLDFWMEMEAAQAAEMFEMVPLLEEEDDR